MLTASSALTTKLVVLVLPGEIVDETKARTIIEGGDLVIAVDGGLDHIVSWGLEADVVVGDFDSVDAQNLQRAKSCGSEIVQYPQDKDATDTELALVLADERGASEITVLGCWGQRRDHELATTLCLCAKKFSHIAITATDGQRLMWVLHDVVDLEQPSGSVLSLIAVLGDVVGITTSGLRWQLDDETLKVATGRGISNVCESRKQHISIKSGVLLVFGESNR